MVYYTQDSAKENCAALVKFRGVKRGPKGFYAGPVQVLHAEASLERKMASKWDPWDLQFGPERVPKERFLETENHYISIYKRDARGPSRARHPAPPPRLLRSGFAFLISTCFLLLQKSFLELSPGGLERIGIDFWFPGGSKVVISLETSFKNQVIS